MLKDIVYVVSSVGHFGSMSSERERESVCVFSRAVGTFYWGWTRDYK